MIQYLHGSMLSKSPEERSLEEHVLFSENIQVNGLLWLTKAIIKAGSDLGSAFIRRESRAIEFSL